MDPQRVAEHILELLDMGMNHRQIAQKAGVGSNRLTFILEGKVEKVRRRTGEAILSVKYEQTFDDDDRYLPWPSLRRVGALLRIGHPATVIAEEAGMSQSAMNQLIQGRLRRVSSAQALGIQLAYEKFRDTPGERHQAKRIARQRGWAPPEAYEEGELDDLEPTRTMLVFRRWEKEHPPSPGEQLFDLIEKNDYTLAEFAAAVGVKTEVIRGYCSETFRPRTGLHKKMRELLKVEVLPIPPAWSGERPSKRKTD